jgi:hypothetical protein
MLSQACEDTTPEKHALAAIEVLKLAKVDAITKVKGNFGL